MSFLSKRSRSTRSFTRGEDQITVRRVEPTEDVATEGRDSTETCDSRSSSPPYVDATDYALHESCVLRKFPKHKSSHLRFLAWVAYTRKFTDEAITEDERRTCPLLWCRTVFRDQETMLQHVWNCEHLSKGLYWCFHCQRPERVGKFQCKRCQGMPSRTDRLTSVAKRIFSKLGTKHHRHSYQPTPEPDMALAKCSDLKPLDQPEYPQMYDAGPVEDWSLPNASSSTGVRDWSGSMELPDTQISEMSGSSCPMELSAGPENWLVPAYTEPQQEWFLPEPAKAGSSAPKATKRLETMLPPLNTQSLNPIRQHSRTQRYSSNNLLEEPMAATLISPLSATPNFHGVSPTDTEVSGRSFFTNDSGYTSGTVVSSMSSSSAANFELNPSFNEPRGTKRSRDSAEDTAQPTSKGIKSAVGSVSSNHSPSRCPSTKKPKLQSPHWSSASTLAAAFSEILDTHITHSKSILRSLPPSPIVTELLAMSRTSLVSIGLETLTSIIQGRNPTAIVQVFAFTHIAYAFSIAVDCDEIKVHTQEWFSDAVSWGDELGSERQRNAYLGIAKAIWQPVESLRERGLPGLFVQGDRENRLFLACKLFLDSFESFGPAAKTETEQSFDFEQPLFARKAKTQVIDELIKTVSIEAFIEDVVKVEKRLERGHISNVRELELELMCAGKLASQSEIAYTRFLTHATTLCTTLYPTDASKARATFHINDIALIKSMLPEEMYCEYDRDFELELDDDMPLNCDVSFPRDGCVDGLRVDVDEILNFKVPEQSPHRASSSTSKHTPPTPTPPSESPTPAPLTTTNNTTKELKCPICAYIPTGEEKWKASNLRRHKRTQHPKLEEGGKKVWRCGWEGCGSVFTRSDNLRSHARDKGHEVGVGKVKGKGEERVVEEEVGFGKGKWNGREEGDERSVKRRKVVGLGVE